jgi:hypothetical protein
VPLVAKLVPYLTTPRRQSTDTTDVREEMESDASGMIRHYLELADVLLDSEERDSARRAA